MLTINWKEASRVLVRIAKNLVRPALIIGAAFAIVKLSGLTIFGYSTLAFALVSITAFAVENTLQRVWDHYYSTKNISTMRHTYHQSTAPINSNINNTDKTTLYSKTALALRTSNLTLVKNQQQPKASSGYIAYDLQLTHTHITTLGKHLSYIIVGEGLCRGLTLRWMEACFLNEEDKLTKRVHQIILNATAPQNLLDRINEVKGKTKSLLSLTEDDIDGLEILAFYESLLLYHSPRNYTDIFNKLLYQGDIEIISKVAASEKILKKGGLRKVYAEPCIFTRDEIITYLNKIRNIIKDTQNKVGTGILLSRHNHTTGLFYQPENDVFRFMDINQWPPKEFKADELDNMVDIILRGLNPSGNPYTAFNATAITTGNNELQHEIFTKLDKLKKSHEITKETAARKAENGITLAYIAAKDGDVDVIAKLAKQGTDFNIPNNEGNTPAYIASQNGHVDVIAELAKHEVNFNIPNNEGTTPAYIASQNGHVDVIAELAKHKVNFNIPGNEGAYPAHVASQNGHVGVIAELIKHNADFNIPLKNGATPLFMASQKGHVEIVKILLKENVNIQPFIAAATSLRNFANSHGEMVINRMNQIIKNKMCEGSSSEESISILPNEIAHIMCHDEIVKLFSDTLAEQSLRPLSNIK